MVSSMERYGDVHDSTFVCVDTLVTETGELSSNITFDGDYDALSASGELELKRAIIFNYLVSIGMPLVSDIVLMKGMW
jgi:hypothetical protein